MPNGIEPPKIVLARQAEIPKLALAGSPVAALGEGLSGILASFAQNVPDILPPPGLPAGGMGGVQLPDVFKGLEASLPKGFPKLAGAGNTEIGAGTGPPPARPAGPRIIG